VKGKLYFNIIFHELCLFDNRFFNKILYNKKIMIYLSIK